jgi:hypothetical protein
MQAAVWMGLGLAVALPWSYGQRQPCSRVAKGSLL